MNEEIEAKIQRDAWCKSHGVVLTDGEYILAQDYTISMEKR